MYLIKHISCWIRYHCKNSGVLRNNFPKPGNLAIEFYFYFKWNFILFYSISILDIQAPKITVSNKSISDM